MPASFNTSFSDIGNFGFQLLGQSGSTSGSSKGSSSSTGSKTSTATGTQTGTGTSTTAGKSTGTQSSDQRSNELLTTITEALSGESLGQLQGVVELLTGEIDNVLGGIDKSVEDLVIRSGFGSIIEGANQAGAYNSTATEEALSRLVAEATNQGALARNSAVSNLSSSIASLLGIEKGAVTKGTQESTGTVSEDTTQVTRNNATTSERSEVTSTQEQQEDIKQSTKQKSNSKQKQESDGLLDKGADFLTSPLKGLF